MLVRVKRMSETKIYQYFNKSIFLFVPHTQELRLYCVQSVHFTVLVFEIMKKKSITVLCLFFSTIFISVGKVLLSNKFIFRKLIFDLHYNIG